MSHEAEELQHLVRMANQIALNMAPMGSQETSAERVYEHIAKYWAKRMKTLIKANLESVSEQLNPTAAAALAKL